MCKISHWYTFWLSYFFFFTHTQCASKFFPAQNASSTNSVGGWTFSKHRATLRRCHTCKLGSHTGDAFVNGVCGHNVIDVDPVFNGSHFGLPLSSFQRMTGLGGKMVWNMTSPYRPHCTGIGLFDPYSTWLKSDKPFSHFSAWRLEISFTSSSLLLFSDRTPFLNQKIDKIIVLTDGFRKNYSLLNYGGGWF